MISFKQFLLESDGPPDYQAIADMIKRDCKPWLAEARGHFAYRGMYLKDGDTSFKPVDASYDGSFYIGTIRKDRKPKDSPLWLHNVLNDTLQQESGIAYRSSSLFVVGDYGQSQNFGNTYLIFPIGEFKYAWSKKLIDPTHDLYMGPLENGTISDEAMGPLMKTAERKFLKFLKDVYPDVREDVSTFDEFREWAIAHDQLEYDDLLNNANTAIWVKFVTQFVKTSKVWQYDSGLADALNKYSEHEVMIAGDKYYAVNTRTVNQRTLHKLL